MLIDDGYTESVDQFRIRRFLTSERIQFEKLIFGEHFTAARHMLSSHITDQFGTIVGLTLVPEEVATMVVTNPTEQSDLANLKSGMRLLLSDPKLAMRTCDLCKTWWFDQDTGRVVTQGGQPVPRPSYAELPCRLDRGCGRGTPENPKSFNARNQQAFNHWQQWRAVGCPCPQDAIVRRNWMWFQNLRENHGLREIRNRLQIAKNGR